MKKRAVFIVNVIFTFLTVETAILVSVFGQNDYNSNVADDIFGKTSVFFYVYIFLEHLGEKSSKPNLLTPYVCLSNYIMKDKKM